MKFLSLTVACTALCFAPLAALAQANTVWHEMTAGTDGCEFSWSDMILGPDGTVYACGTELFQNHEVPVVKCWYLDGTEKWSFRYPTVETGPYIGARADRIVLQNGYLYTAGSGSQSMPYSQRDIYVQKIYASSGQLSTKRWYDPGTPMGSQTFRSITIDGENLILAGDVNQHQLFVLKLDPALNIQWTETRQFVSEAGVTQLETLPNGDVLVALDDSPLGHSTFMRYVGSTGAYGMSRTVFGASSLSFATLPDSSIVLGYRQGPNYESKVEGLTSAYGTAWEVSDSEPMRKTVVHYSDGGAALYQLLHGYNDTSFRLRKFNPDHTIAWEDEVTNQVGSIQQYILNSDRFGNPIVVANTLKANDLNFKAWCWDENGKRQWSSELGASQSTGETAAAFVVDNDLRLFAAGRSSLLLGSQISGASWRTSQHFDAAPNALMINSGVNFGGGVSSVQTADSNTLIVGGSNSAGPLDRLVNVSFSTKFPIGPVRPAEVQFGLKLRSRATQVGVLQTLQLWDWSSNTWHTIDFRSCPTTMQTTVVSGLNIAQFVEPATREVRARLLAAQPRTMSRAGFKVVIDYVEWFTNL